MISVISYYTTKFGELWEKSLFDLVKEATREILKKTDLDTKQIDAVFFANMLAGVLENNLHSSAKIAEILKSHIPVYRVEAACASGGVAFNLANNYLEANPGKTVLVLGAEKMTDYSPEEITQALAGAASGEEQEAGLTFPGLYAMMANYYCNKFGYSEENLAHVSVKNHYHGSLNDRAQFTGKITVEDVLQSPYVAFPLKVLDSSPISDGASALILSSNSSLIKKAQSAQVLACEMANDSIGLKSRTALDRIEATGIAAEKAFKKTKIKKNNIDIAEVHDCFSIGEILAMEDLGFWPRGEAGKLMAEGLTRYGSKAGGPIVNTSGGLKAAGHPIGATGIKQIGEVYLQLTGQATNRQVVEARYGLAHNVGGSGGTAVVTILGV